MKKIIGHILLLPIYAVMFFVFVYCPIRFLLAMVFDIIPATDTWNVEFLGGFVCIIYAFGIFCWVSDKGFKLIEGKKGE